MRARDVIDATPVYDSALYLISDDERAVSLLCAAMMRAYAGAR